MRAGLLSQRVAILQRNLAKDSYGEDVETWTSLATVWAQEKPLKGAEFFAAKQVNAELATKIHVRYRSDVKPEMRLQIGARILNIQSVVNVDGRKKELELLCSEVV